MGQPAATVPATSNNYNEVARSNGTCIIKDQLKQSQWDSPQQEHQICMFAQW